MRDQSHSDKHMNLQDLKKRAFPKGFRRWGTNTLNRIAHRTSEKDFARAFTKLDIAPGSFICVHAALNGLGYLPGGAVSIFSALQAAVPDCTLMMPSFPFSGTTIQYLEEDPVFDRNRTPSKSAAC